MRSAIHSHPFALAVAGMLAACIVGNQAHAASLPEPVLREAYALQRVGSGQLTWFGRPVYEASLWTSAGRFTGYAPGQPVALSLWYGRSFSRNELLRITSTAWRLLDAATPAQRDAWLGQLGSLWEDVEPGHNLTAVVLPGTATHFYDHRRQLGRIDDPAFGPAYLDIWLDSRTVVDELRLQLLGARAQPWVGP